MKKGFTLVEIMVAIFIFVLIIIAAYQVYERSQKTYILGEQLSDLQQNVRFAYEQISYDLRIAGFNVYPDDESTRPDEQIEGAWSGAIAIRADFNQSPASSDYTCTDSNNDRLCDEGTGQFSSVSTDNSEIRIYALAKKPNDSGETIKFLADLSKPRDAKVGELDKLEKISITGVAINQTDPPYTLYRITIDPNENIPDGGVVPQRALVWTPLASNIYSLKFTYYNEQGIGADKIIPSDENDISSKENDYLKKHGYPFGSAPTNFIKNVQFTLRGVTQNPDPRWVDSKDPYPATKNKRKIDLSSTIVLKNLGVSPHELADTVPPDGPTDLDYTTGYCNGVLLTWLPSMALDVTSYYIQVAEETLYSTWGYSWKYNCDDFPSTCTILSTPEAHTNGRVGYYITADLEYGKHYYARVFSQDKAGNFSLDSTNTVDFYVTPNPIKPKAPQLSIVTQEIVDNFNRLKVHWFPPVGYDESQSSTCKEPPATEDAYFSTKVRDLYGYRLYHKRFPTQTASDFAVDEEGNKVATEKDETGAPKIDATLTSYPDVKACPCEYYAYKMKSVTSCSTIAPVGDPSCSFISELSDISKDADSNPVAYQIPELQDFSINPQIVPAKPEKLFASAVEISPENYSVTLTFPIIFNIVEKDNSAFPPTYTALNDIEIECWRYKVYMYDNETDATNDENSIEVLDTNLSGAGDLDDWDAGIDGGKDNLKKGETLSFSIGEFNIPTGEGRFFRVRGYYKCASGDYLGKLSEYISVPCNTKYGVNIIDPPIDDLTITQPLYNITLGISSLPLGVIITSVEFAIPNPYNEKFTTTCVGSPDCTAIFPWNNTAYPDARYLITATITDSNGCSAFTQRWVNLNRNCGDYLIQNQSTFNDELTFELYKQNSTTYVLLKGISFSSTGNYLYDWINFYEQDPSFGSPTPFTLWQSNIPEDMNNQWIGYNYFYPFMQYNWCEYLRFYPDPSNSTKSNWFRINFDKNIDSSNGPLNLIGNFRYANCDGSETQSYNIPKNKSTTINFNKTACYYKLIPTTKEPTVTDANYCSGSFTLFCPAAGGSICQGYIQIFYPSSELKCTNIPVFIGP